MLWKIFVMILKNENAINGFLPEKNLNVSEWAEEYRVMSSVSCPEPGKWKTSRTPYLREIMDCLSPQHPCDRVVFMKGAQIGATEMGNNWLGYIMHYAPGPTLVVFPTVETAKRHSKMRLSPLIDDCKELKKIVQSTKANDPGNTIMMKEFQGGVLILTGANSAVGLRSLPIRYLFMDEVDGYPDDAGGEGDPVSLALKRTSTFYNKKVFMLSTPKIKDESRIERAFLEGDQRYFNVPCIHCNEYIVIKWKNIKWDSGNVQNAYLVCEKCGGVIENHNKTEMLSKGKWIAEHPEKKGSIASFHLSALYSPHGWVSWGDLAKDFLEAKSDPTLLQVWVNTTLGESWEDQGGEAVDPTGLMQRTEDFGKYLPDQICILTCGVDVQDDRLEFEVVGWGRNEQSWSIEYGVIYGDPSTNYLWEKLDEQLLKKYEHTRNIPPLRITSTCIDSGGHYSDQVLHFTESRRIKRRVWAIKGSSGGFGVPIFPSRVSRSSKGRKRLYVIGVNDAKDIIMKRLRIKDKGAGYCNFPHGRDPEWFSQLTGEIIKKRLHKGRYIREFQPRKKGAPVEALDCRVYAFAALRGLMQNHRLRLNRVADVIESKDIIPKNMVVKTNKEEKEEMLRQQKQQKKQIKRQPKRKKASTWRD